MEFRSAVLDNGLEVIAECQPSALSTAVGFLVNSGARDEDDSIAGVSHFLEHMVFKGTPTRSADDVNREFDEMGAHYNAFTTEEKTVYYAAVLPEYQTAAVELWADVLRPSLRESDFATEKQVIIEEIKMYEDQPPFSADEIVRERFFAGHPLGRSVLGSAESIRALPVERMRAYFERRYSPANIVLAAAGRVDFDELVAAARRSCGSWQRHDAPRTIEPPRPKSGFECMVRASATQEYVLQLANGPSATDEMRFAAKLLSVIVGDDSGSRMYWELLDPGHAESASLGHHEYHGAGMFFTYLNCQPEQAADNLARLADLFARLERGGVTAEELEQAKNKVNARVVLSSERPRGRLFTVGANWTYRHEYRSVADDLAAVDAVTLADISAVLARYPLSQSMTMAVGPLADLAPQK